MNGLRQIVKEHKIVSIQSKNIIITNFKKFVCINKKAKDLANHNEFEPLVWQAMSTDLGQAFCRKLFNENTKQIVKRGEGHLHDTAAVRAFCDIRIFCFFRTVNDFQVKVAVVKILELVTVSFLRSSHWRKRTVVDCALLMNGLIK